MTAAYAGIWLLERSITDHDRGTVITCAGSARLVPRGASLTYDETVMFELAGKPMRATRTYRFASRGSFITATFSDGSPFFELRLDPAGTGAATHACGDDDYALRLELREPSVWQTIWDVSGTKRLRIVTNYRRLHTEL